MVEIYSFTAKGFRVISCTQDVCKYTRQKKEYLFFLAIYVDGLVIVLKSIKDIVELEEHLQKRFSMKPIGDIDYILGFNQEK